MLTHDQALTLIETSHHEWRRANLDGLFAQYSDDMEFWCNVGDPSGGPVEMKGKEAFRETLAAVLRTTRCWSNILTFDYDENRARILAEYRMEHIASAVSLKGTYRQLVFYKGQKIKRLEEYHDAGRLNAFWKLTAEGAVPKTVVWDAEGKDAQDLW
jgi:ketosteroid isomerase-like protein